MSKSDDLNIARALLTIAVAAVVVFLVMTVIQSRFALPQQANLEAQRLANEPGELLRLQAGQTRELDSYRWIDQEKGIVGIPIDRAMELVVREASTASP